MVYLNMIMTLIGKMVEIIFIMFLVIPFILVIMVLSFIYNLIINFISNESSSDNLS